MATNQEVIDNLIDYIDKAILKNSVSNRQVAAVLAFLNERQKNIPSLSGYATEGYVTARFAEFIGSAPAALDTVYELAAALQGNTGSINDIMTSLGTKWTQDNIKIAAWDNAVTLAHTHANKAVIDGITSALISNWNTAAGWGNHASAGYMHLAGTETVLGEKNFTGGLKVNGQSIVYNAAGGYWQLNGSLVLSGGLVTFANLGDVNIPSIYANLPVDGTTIGRNASGALTVLGGVGLDTAEMWAALSAPTNEQIAGSHLSNALAGYALKTEIPSLAGYALKSEIPSLAGYATESYVTARFAEFIGSAPAALDTVYELAAALQGNTGSINDIMTALGTKWTQDNTKIAAWDNASALAHTHTNKSVIDGITGTLISNWNTAAGWGNHASAGYMHLAGTETVLGEKNFTGGLKVNGQPIAYNAAGGYWQLNGSLVLSGGLITFANLGDVNIPSIYANLPIDGVSIKRDANGVLYAVGGAGGVGTVTAISVNGSTYNPVNGIISLPNYALAGHVHNFADITNKPSTLGGYGITDALSLSGGVLTGELTLSIAGLTADNFIKFKNDTQNCYLGIRNPYGIYGLTFVSPDGAYNKVWHEGNDGSGSGLDADTLDGLHRSSFFRTSGGTLYNLNDQSAVGYNSTGWWYPSTVGTPNGGYGILMSISDYVEWYNQLGFGTDNKIYFRQSINSPTNFGTWNTVAFITDNVASATKLQTARTIAGVSFDGSTNISIPFANLSSIPTTLSGYGITDAYTSSSADATFLKLTGGVLTTTVSNAPLILSAVGMGNHSYLGYKNGATVLGYIGVSNINSPAFVNTSGNIYKIWHEGNDGAGSGLDADTLDGLNGESFGRFFLGYEVNANTIPNGFYGGKLYNASNFPYAYYAFISAGYDKYKMQFNGHNNQLAYRAGSEDGFESKVWRSVAFEDSNVASATKLSTSRAIWGKNFDGTGNVSGDLIGVGSLYTSGYLYSNISGTYRAIIDYSYTGEPDFGFGTSAAGLSTYLDGNNIYFRTSTGHLNRMVITSSGNISIGGEVDYGYKLYVNGNGRFIGDAEFARIFSYGTINAYKNTPTNTLYSGLGIQVYSSDGSPVGIGFHRGGYSQTILEHSGDGLVIRASGTIGTGSLGNLYVDTVNSGTILTASLTARDWLRVIGTVGISFEDFSGGIYMTDSKFIRFYGSKALLISNTDVDSIKTNGGVMADNWFRSNSTTGWYNSTFSGGIYMEDSDQVRVYGNKVFYNDGVRAWGINGHNVGLKLYSADHVGINLANSSYTWGIYSNGNGNLYIGRRTGNVNDSSGSYRLTIGYDQLSYEGSIVLYGGGLVTFQSDMRLKTNIQGFDATLDQLADLPIFTHEWRDGTPGVYMSTSAQAVRDLMPCNVQQGKDGYLVMDGTRTALAVAIRLAQIYAAEQAKLTRWQDAKDKQIERLQDTVRELSNRVYNLENR